MFGKLHSEGRTMDEMIELPENIRKDIIEFRNSPEYQQLALFYKQKSFFEVLGIQRREIRHSSFLAWMFNPNEFHGLGSISLQKLLEVCALVLSDTHQKHPANFPDNFFDDLIASGCSFSNTHVSTEKSVRPDGQIDIFIDTSITIKNQTRKLWIIIENKIASQENNKQTIRYRDWIEQKKDPDDLALLLYLTPMSTLKLSELKAPECECEDFLQINYQYVLEYLIEPSVERTPSERARKLMEEYIRALSVRAITDDTQNNKGDLIMAISSTERKLLNAFWEKHQKLILAAFLAISSDPDQEKDTREIAKEVTQFFSPRNRDRYSILFDGEIQVDSIQKTRIGYEVCRVLLLKEKMSIEEFDLLKRDMSSAHKLLMRKEEIPENMKPETSKYNRYRLGRETPLEFRGEEYHASGNWNEGTIPKFEKFLQENFPLVEIRKDKT